MRILGIDYGDKRIGLALSDMLNILASPMELYVRKTLEYDLRYLAELAAKNNVKTIVIGLPINMDGTLGERSAITKEFGNALEKFVKLPVVYVDERWTSKESERVLIESNVRRDKRKALVDVMAAQNILQRYLDGPNNR